MTTDILGCVIPHNPQGFIYVFSLIGLRGSCAPVKIRPFSLPMSEVLPVWLQPVG